jgi:hypothetical protein
MATNDQSQSLDRTLRRALSNIETRLIEMGVNPECARETASQQADRLYISGKGPIRVLQRGTQGEFMPGSYVDPLAPLVSELFNRTSDDNKLVAVERNAEEAAKITEEKAASGGYDL